LVALCVDYGTKNIGLAYTPDGVFAFPLASIKKTELNSDINAIIVQASEKNAELIVVGYPASDIESDSAKYIRGFAQRLSEKSGLRVVLQDESFTSMQAREIGHDLGKTDKKMRNTKDQIEAQIILMRYLKSLPKP
jgi:putative Holliday junction resolvase